MHCKSEKAKSKNVQIKINSDWFIFTWNKALFSGNIQWNAQSIKQYLHLYIFTNIIINTTHVDINI